MAHFLTKSKILLVFILLLNTVISFGNNQNKIHSLQTSFSYCMYQNYNNGKAITINYHFPVSNWLSTTSAVTIADGKPKGVSIEESYDYSALNIGFEFHHNLWNRLSLYASPGICGSWFVNNKVIGNIAYEERTESIHLINGTANIGYFIDCGIDYWFLKNVALTINYNTSYMSVEKHNIHFIGIGCRFNIVN